MINKRLRLNVGWFVFSFGQRLERKYFSRFGHFYFLLLEFHIWLYWLIAGRPKGD
jgi:hypothetical protein